MTILLTEDDEGLGLVFSKMLKRNGYKVLVARSAAEALTICGRGDSEIHLLLTDIMLPEMNGLELAREAQRLRPGLRVLYMSGYTEDVITELTSKSSGPIHLIQKPFNTQALVEKVKGVLVG